MLNHFSSPHYSVNHYRSGSYGYSEDITVTFHEFKTISVTLKTHSIASSFATSKVSSKITKDSMQ